MAGEGRFLRADRRLVDGDQAGESGLQIVLQRQWQNDLAGELGITADYALFSQFRVNVGYSLIYWTTVARVGDQVDTSVNPNQIGVGTIVDPAAPTFNLSTTGFWAQGVNVGFEYQF